MVTGSTLSTRCYFITIFIVLLILLHNLMNFIAVTDMDRLLSLNVFTMTEHIQFKQEIWKDNASLTV